MDFSLGEPFGPSVVALSTAGAATSGHRGGRTLCSEHMITRASVYALLLAATALLAGACGGDDNNRPSVVQPASTVSTTVTDATSPSPSPTASRSPGSAIDDTTRQELLSLPGRYYDAIEHAYRTLDYKPVEALVSPDCMPCRAQLNYLRKAAREKYRHELGDYTVTKVKLLGEPAATRNNVSIHLAVDGLVVRNAEGKLVAKEPPSRGPQQIDAELKDGKWRIREVLGF